MMDDSGSGVESSPVQNISAQYAKIHRTYQQVLDRWTPFMLYRWLATAGLLVVFLLRIVLAQGVSLHSLHSNFTPAIMSLNLTLLVPSHSGILVCLFFFRYFHDRDFLI